MIDSDSVSPDSKYIIQLHQGISLPSRKMGLCAAPCLLPHRHYNVQNPLAVMDTVLTSPAPSAFAVPEGAWIPEQVTTLSHSHKLQRWGNAHGCFKILVCA